MSIFAEVILVLPERQVRNHNRLDKIEQPSYHNQFLEPQVYKAEQRFGSVVGAGAPLEIETIIKFVDAAVRNWLRLKYLSRLPPYIANGYPKSSFLVQYEYDQYKGC